MKKNIFLSLKRTLLATLPCMALSLFVVSCSDDDSAVVTDKATKGKTITFTTVAPVITDYSTRVGIDEGNLPTSGTDNEPLFWLEGDELAFNFVKYGETVGQVYPYTISPVGPGRYEITTDSEINISNGLYEVHVVSPSLEPGVKTFSGGDVAGTTIDLRGQEQPETTNNYKNLTDYYYQYAYTLVKIEDNEIVQGGNFIEFTALTSLIRYRITNSFDDPIQVVKINVSYNDNSTSPFYTRGTFDPTAAEPAIQPVGSPVKTLGLKTEKTLAKGEQLNAFLSMLPISIPASTNITYTVFFNKGGQLYKKVWNVTAANLANGDVPAGGRWLQGLTMTDGNISEADESELLDEEEDELPGGDDITPVTVTVGDYEISYLNVSDEELIVLVNDYGVWINLADWPNACPADFAPVNYQLFYELYDDLISLFTMGEIPFLGRYDYLNGHIANTNIIYGCLNDNRTAYLNANTGSFGFVDKGAVHIYRPLCYRELP